MSCIFMLQDMAMPYITHDRGPWARGLPIDAGKAGRLNCAITVVASPGFVRTVSFQPISLASGGIRGSGESDTGRRITFKWLPLDDLDIDEVEMDRMGISGKVEQLPDLDRAGSRGFRSLVNEGLSPGRANSGYS